MNGAEVLVKMLIEQGVEVIFGVPGDTSLHFYEALSRVKSKIKHVICRDERNAVYMADGYARVTGKPGVVEVPSGGGALYAVPGVSEANESSIPLICISSDISMSSYETGAITDVDQIALFKPITKWTGKIQLAEKIPHYMRKAFRIASMGRPGAVHVCIPENILGYEFPVQPNDIYAMDFTKVINLNTNKPDEVDLFEAITRILGAKKPLILAGGGVHLSSAYDELERFSTCFQVPVATSINGKGTIKEISEYSIGVVGANGSTEESNKITKNADLYIVLGSRLNNVTTMGKDIFNMDAYIIQVDISEDYLGANIKINQEFLCDIKSFLTSLTEGLLNFKDSLNKQFKPWNNWIKAELDIKDARQQEESEIETESISPAYFFNVLEELTNEDTIFVADAGTPTPYLSSYFKLKKAGRFTVIPRTHGCLGFSLPSAIGVNIAKPQSKVFALFGDGSFAMSVGELETAARLNQPVVFINFQNYCFGWIKTIQKLYFDENYHAVDFNKIDAGKIAQGFGVEGRRISTNEEVKDVLKWAISRNKPVLLDVIIEPPTRLTPPVLKWQRDSKISPENRKKLTY